MHVIGLKSCDTCRKALKAIRAAGFDPSVQDVRADGLSPDDIATLTTTFGDKAINRASTTWRGLTDDEKTQSPEALLAAHPTLLKRPAIQHNGQWTLGWKPDVAAQVLGHAT